MVVRLTGIIRGRKRIDLESEVALEDGARVDIQIETPERSPAQMRRALSELCGAWNDDSLDEIFAELDRNRALPPREVSLDDPS